MPITLAVNGRTHTLDVDPETPLLWVLRDTLGLVGTKFGCGGGFCGACTVHVDGVATRAVHAAAGKVGAVARVGDASRALAHPVQRAWADLDVRAVRLLPGRAAHDRRGAARAHAARPPTTRLPPA